MDLKIKRKTQNDSGFSDPLMKYIDDHLKVISIDLVDDFIYDMETLYSYIIDLRVEFCTANPKYRTPCGFSINYSRSCCCLSSISIVSINESIHITPMKNEKDENHHGHSADNAHGRTDIMHTVPGLSGKHHGGD